MIDKEKSNLIEELLRRSMSQLKGQIPTKDVADVSEYLEYGVAFDLLEFAIDKNGLERPTSLNEAAHELGLLE